MFQEEKINYIDFDIYSRRISFFYKNKEKMGSLFGFILTILYAFISIMIFLFYFIRTIKRVEVSSSTSTIYATDNLSLNINNDIFNFAFGLEHPTTLKRFIDETIYYPQVLYVEKIKENGEYINQTETILDFEKCSNDKFPKNYQNLFENDELNNSYCLKDFNITLISGFKYKKMTFIRINIFPCVNTTENKNHCKPQNIIDEYLASTYFSMSAKDIGYNPFNYSFPIAPILQDLYASIDKSIFKEYIMYFGIAEINTDKGFFQSNIQKETYAKYIKDFYTFYFIDKEHYYSGKQIFTAEIRLENNIYFFKRDYANMSEVFTKTGGYMQFLYTFFSLIALLTKKISIERNLLNSLFNFDIKQKKIILFIEYEKKIDYNFYKNKKKENNYIPFVAKKSLITVKRGRRNNIFSSTKDLPKIIRNGSEEESNSENFKKRQNSHIIPNEGLIEIVKKITKEKKQKNTNMIDQSINRSGNNMIIDDNNQNLNGLQLNKIYRQKVEKRKSKSNILNNLKKFEEGRRTTINFNVFEYYCLWKLPRKKTKIELFNSGINFYKRQMDIVNFFNILMLTQIMLTQQSIDKKQNYLNQTIELSVK